MFGVWGLGFVELCLLDVIKCLWAVTTESFGPHFLNKKIHVNGCSMFRSNLRRLCLGFRLDKLWGSIRRGQVNQGFGWRVSNLRRRMEHAINRTNVSNIAGSMILAPFWHDFARSCDALSSPQADINIPRPCILERSASHLLSLGTHALHLV